jgi:hypothetical protein
VFDVFLGWGVLWIPLPTEKRCYTIEPQKLSERFCPSISIAYSPSLLFFY